MLDILRTAAIFSIPFLLVLTVVVAIHELGHFLVAKACGVAIDRFSIGFGKAIFKRTDKSGVEWRIGWIPLGGYVRFAGDSNEASVPDTDDLTEMRRQIEEKLGKEAVGKFYAFKPVWQRSLIAIAGPVANFVLAIAIFFVLFMSFDVGRQKPQVGEVIPNSPAAAAGFAPGDMIKTVNGRRMRDFGEFSLYIALHGGDTMAVVVDRGGKDITLTPTLRRVTEKDSLTGATVKKGQIGVRPAADAYYLYRAAGPGEALGEAVHAVRVRLESTFIYLGRIFKGRENGDQISGIIGMAGVTGSVTKATIEQSESVGGLFEGMLGFMVPMMASISIGLGFVNLLPIPMLDGGHLVFYAYEAVARRPLAAKVQAASFKVGLALVLALMLFATWNDLQRYDAFRFIGGLIS